MKLIHLFIIANLWVNSLSGIAQSYTTRNTSLRDAYRNTEKCEWLDLSKQELRELPDSVFLLVNLKYLDLSRTHLQELPTRIGELKQLRYLVLSHNKLKKLPPQISNLHLLQSLYLDHNPELDVAEAIHYLNELPNLHMLSLAGDHISTIPSEISGLKVLESLELSENEFSMLPETMIKMKKLKVLYVNNDPYFNLKDNFRVLSKINSLNELHIENDSLNEIPAGISQLKIEYLFLVGNNISELPPEIGRMKKLKLLDMSENPLPPPLFNETLSPQLNIKFRKKEN
jgi:leucine-rich repeat protein SHOC2